MSERSASGGIHSSRLWISVTYSRRLQSHRSITWGPRPQLSTRVPRLLDPPGGRLVSGGARGSARGAHKVEGVLVHKDVAHRDDVGVVEALEQHPFAQHQHRHPLVVRVRVVVDCLYLFYCHPLPCLGVERGIDRPAPPGASPRGEPRRRHAQGGGGARVHAPRRTSGQREDAAHPYAPERMWTICVKRLWACCCGSAAPPPAGGCTAAASAAASIPPARRAPQGQDQDTTASDCQRLRSRAHREWGNIQVCAQPRPGGRAGTHRETEKPR